LNSEASEANTLKKKTKMSNCAKRKISGVSFNSKFKISQAPQGRMFKRREISLSEIAHAVL
jgi:hypothetical protein